MKYTRSLRYRITLSFFLFGLLLAAGIAAGVKFVIEDIEQRLLAESLDVEFDYFRSGLKEGGEIPMLTTATLRTYVALRESMKSVPVFLASLAPGRHELVDRDRHYQVRVDDVNGRRLFLVRDVTLFEKRENAIFATLVVLVVLASGAAVWLGYVLSQKVIAPVSNLARSVTNLKPQARAQPMSSQYAQDEVGELAQAFDRYLERLSDFVEREQEFTSNASHELRTPLTVIGGAVELLMADKDISERSVRVLERIQRAVKDMGQVVDSLLFLAREQNGSPATETRERVRVLEVVDEVIEDARHLLNNKAVVVKTHVNGDAELSVPRPTLAIVLGNLLRNAFAYTREGEVNVIIEQDRIEIRDTGVGIKPEELARVFERHYRGGEANATGSGLGLSIVKRICERNRWRVEVDTAQNRGTGVIIYLKP